MTGQGTRTFDQSTQLGIRSEMNAKAIGGKWLEVTSAPARSGSGVCRRHGALLHNLRRFRGRRQMRLVQIARSRLTPKSSACPKQMRCESSRKQATKIQLVRNTSQREAKNLSTKFVTKFVTSSTILSVRLAETTDSTWWSR